MQGLPKLLISPLGVKFCHRAMPDEGVLSQTRFLLVYTADLALTVCCRINSLTLPL